jgi:hypothetical protein
MRDETPSPENASPGSGSEGVPPWREMGEAWTSIMTAWADLTTGWTSLVTAWMRASGSWMGMNPMRGMDPEAAASWARQVMECMARAAPAPKPPAPPRARPHATPARRASEDHVRGIIVHRDDTSEDLPPLADGT